MNLKLSSVPYLTSFLHSSITIPKQWIQDIKFVEFNELLSTSTSTLALVFSWNKHEKSERLFFDDTKEAPAIYENRLEVPAFLRKNQDR